MNLKHWGYYFITFLLLLYGFVLFDQKFYAGHLELIWHLLFSVVDYFISYKVANYFAPEDNQ